MQVNFPNLLDSIQEPVSTYESIEGFNVVQCDSYVNEERVYETTEVIKSQQESSSYTSLTNKQETPNSYQPLQLPVRGTTTDKIKGVDQHEKDKVEQTMEYENPAFNAKCSDE